MPYSVDGFRTSEALQALGRFLQLTASLAARSEGGSTSTDSACWRDFLGFPVTA
jgi:hypothetical protein